jgi:hypothetical protein
VIDSLCSQILRLRIAKRCDLVPRDFRYFRLGIRHQKFRELPEGIQIKGNGLEMALGRYTVKH